MINEKLMSNHQLELANQLHKDGHLYYCTCRYNTQACRVKNVLWYSWIRSVHFFPCRSALASGHSHKVVFLHLSLNKGHWGAHFHTCSPAATQWVIYLMIKSWKTCMSNEKLHLLCVSPWLHRRMDNSPTALDFLPWDCNVLCAWNVPHSDQDLTESPGPRSNDWDMDQSQWSPLPCFLSLWMDEKDTLNLSLSLQR